MEEIMLKIDNVSKMYRLGQIGGTTLRDELQRKMAKLRHQEDPTKRIGTESFDQGERFMALNGVSFEVRKGERVGIIGHNGAGKSTLLKLISRVTAPTGGTISLNGRVASMLEVGTGFHGELTGRENIYMNGAILGMTKKEIDAKIEDIIEFSECRQFIDTPVKRYSSGMYVKLAFSVAAHLDSEIMIMDEVLAVGDMAFQKKCIDKMNSVSRDEGRTILYVSHNMNTIRQLCNRVVVLDHGMLAFNGKVEDGIEKYSNFYLLSDTIINFENTPRFQWLQNPPIRVLRAEAVGKQKCVYFTGESLNLFMYWHNDSDVKSLSVRVEIHKLDGSAVASGFSSAFYSGKCSEEGMAYFDVDLSSLVPGKYSTIYVFSATDQYGNDMVADCVHGHFFEIVPKENEIVWNSTCWGSCRLPEVRVHLKKCL